jgi:hypothetical protein
LDYVVGTQVLKTVLHKIQLCFLQSGVIVTEQSTVVVQYKSKESIPFIHSSNQPTDMGRPSGVKNKKGHKAGGSKPKEKKLPRASTLAAMEVTRLTGLTSSS